MSYKTNPIGNRLGISLSWKAPRELINFKEANSDLQNWIQMYMLIKSYLERRGLKLITFKYEWYNLVAKEQGVRHCLIRKEFSFPPANSPQNLPEFPTSIPDKLERFYFFSKNFLFLKSVQNAGQWQERKILTALLETKKNQFLKKIIMSKKIAKNLSLAEKPIEEFFNHKLIKPEAERFLSIQNIIATKLPKTIAFGYYRYLPDKKPKKGNWRRENRERLRRKPWYRLGSKDVHDIWNLRMTIEPRAYHLFNGSWTNRVVGLMSRRRFKGTYKPMKTLRKFYRDENPQFFSSPSRRSRPQRVWLKKKRRKWIKWRGPRRHLPPVFKLMPYTRYAYRYRLREKAIISTKKKRKTKGFVFAPLRARRHFKTIVKYATRDKRRRPLLLRRMRSKIRHVRRTTKDIKRDITLLLRPYPLLLNKTIFRHEIINFLSKYSAAIPFLKIKMPRIKTRKLRKVPRIYSRKLQTVVKQHSHCINTLRIFYLLKLYKDPTIWVDHFARELGKIKIKRLQWPLIRSFNVFIRCRLLFHKIFQYTRIGVFGRINGSTRTRVHYLMARRRDNEPTHRFLAPIQFAQAQSLAKIGAFGIKMWNFADSKKVERQRNPILKHNVDIYKQIRFEEP